MERWLSLRVSEEKTLENKARKPLFLISIPKKVVRLAVRRNRIRRVLREALRNKPFFEGNKTYVFKVLRSPEQVDLESTRLIVHELFGCAR